jgi:hypothetical protein
MADGVLPRNRAEFGEGAHLGKRHSARPNDREAANLTPSAIYEPEVWRKNAAFDLPAG